MRDNFRLFALIVMLCPSLLVAQELRHQITIQHDNDFLFAIDRYYTTGTFITYDRLVDNDFILKRSAEIPIQVSYTLGQETYTPRELFDTDFDRLERPYAGYLFGRLGVSRADETSILQLYGEIGLAGEQSLAGKFQVAYHELIGEFIPTWAGEIGNSFHINTQAKYTYDIDVSRSNFIRSIALGSTAAFGSRDIYVQQGVTGFIGNRANVSQSAAFNRLSDAQEFYGYAGVGLRYVVLNALIAGHPLGDNSPFVLDETPLLFQFKTGIVYRGSRNTYELGYRFQTKQTEREGRSQYTIFKIARRF